MKLAVCVVLFHPTEEDGKHLSFLKRYASHLFVYDNTQENRGLPAVYNDALSQASSAGCTHLMILDQDSRFTKAVLDQYLSCIGRNKENGVILFSPKHRGVSSQGCAFKKDRMSLSSGWVIDVSHAKSIGGFDESFFIDEVDHEFVLRAWSKGYTTISFDNIVLSHRLGKKHAVWKIRYTCYRPERYYYMLRNFLFLFDRYAGHAFVKERRGYMLKFFLKSLCFCSNRYKIVKMLYRGYKDYRARNQGKRIDIV